ncbi:hypothetical protein K1T71_004679 [Dendrolimus kikuchii]|uniref:Uncharacterized protein n=1 Tax=Dendrolimus kikuchii TaxID=765133 RepID=A0ACC1D916_9NEOP|nr:hypothetical protein K1T71_004679 [Dendrolimus kikuchii]
MSFNYVKLYYGPCASHHSVIHKPQKLKGLRDCLHKLGYRVDLVPVEHINYCVLVMCGLEVFRCNIQNLKFNMHYTLCPVSQRALQAVIDSSAKLQRARSYLWFWQLLEDQLFKRNEYLPKDYWPSKLEIKPFSSCVDCVNCCGILAN